MALKSKRPLTPSQRFYIAHKPEVDKKDPESSLVVYNKRAWGRNCYGRITSRRRGGGHRRLYRIIDFNRNKLDVQAKVTAIEYDPNRTANIALLVYADGHKSYILAPKGLKKGDVVFSTNNKVEDFNPGLSLPLRNIPAGVFIHAIELTPGSGAKIARGAGVGAQLVAVEGDSATLKMPSGEMRYVHSNCRATIGIVGNEDQQNQSLGKAGRNRWLGRRPRVRGVAMNPIDHPHGGGQGRTSGGGHPRSPWGQLAKGYPTRKRKKVSNNMIIVRRNGRKVKKM